MEPSLAGFIDFIRDVMGIDTTILPDDDLYIEFSYEFAKKTCTETLGSIDKFLYTNAVYNLGGDTLLTYGKDQPNKTFFADVQKKYQLNTFVPGVVDGAHDETTGSSLLVPDQFKRLTIGNLQNLKTPYGRLYLQIVQDLGSLSLFGMA